MKNISENHIFKNHKKLKEVSVILLEALIIAGLVLFSLGPISCKVTAEGIRMLDGDYVPPALQGFSVTDSNTLTMIFSEEVTLNGCVLSPFIEDISDSMESSRTEELSEALAAASGAYGSINVQVEYEAEKTVLLIRLEEEMETGKKYEFYGTVKDRIGNTLTFAIPFTGYNARIPKIIMTEIQSETISSQKASEKLDGSYRTEFVEFLALSDGNLAGLELCSGYDGAERNYVFPAVEVNQGEVFVVHLRNKGNGCVSENEDNLALAFGTYTNPSVRDLWSQESGTALGNKTDVVIVRNQADGKVMDAFFYAAEGTEKWQKSMEEYAFLASEYEIYPSAGVEEAFVTTGLTVSKTIIRKNAAELLEKAILEGEIEYPVKAADSLWAVSNEASPGQI